MPVKINDDLPAYSILESENIFVMSEQRADTQDIRPLKILIMNLMPTKVETETQLLRLLSNSPLQTDVEFLQAATHESKNTSQEYLERFYHTFDEVRNKKYDGMIITGAPVECIDFSDVDYWDELCEIMDWTRTNVCSTLYICWGSQAGLYHHYGIRKHVLAEKLSGVFEHRVLEKSNPLFRGFDDVFYVPHSRHSEVRKEDILKVPDLSIVSESAESGVYIIMARNGREIYITGHSEYSPLTLDCEYHRDLSRGMNPHVPTHYYIDDDPAKGPLVRWRSHANLLFSNWLNYFVYQETPYDIRDIK